MRYLRMENWIRNHDSFYVTKDDQKISFSDDFIKSEERTTGLGKGIYSTYKYFDTYIWKQDIFEYKNVCVNFKSYTAKIDGKMIDINAKELEILKYLLDNAGIALSRAQILDHVWKESEDVPYDRVIDVYIKELRKKLGLDCITTIRNVGYKLEKS